MKILRSVMAPLLLLACLLTLLSCDGGNGSDVTTATEQAGTAATVPPTELDLSEYAVIRPAKADENTVAAARMIYEALGRVSGKTVVFKDDFLARGEKQDDNTKEILVGATNRPQTAEAGKYIDGYSYCVAELGNKICVTASDSPLLVDAAGEFIDRYINNSEHGRLIKTEDILLTEKKDAGLGAYTIVLRTGRDSYEEEQAGAIAQFIDGPPSRDVRLISETDRTYSPDSHEILIGDIDCPEVKQLKDELGEAEYGVFWRGKKILLYGHSLATTVKSTAEFLGLLRKNASVVDGRIVVTMPEAVDIKLTETGWRTDFPRFTGGEGADGAYDCGHDSLALFYSGATAAEVAGYRTTLAAAGWTQYSENKIGKYSFAVLKKGGGALYLMHDTASGTLRVISASDETAVADSDESYTKLTELSLTQMCLDYTSSEVGMSYIITLEDGRFIIVDGGHPLTSEANALLAKLRELNRREGKPTIAAWIITHTHSDHSGLFKKFSNMYADDVILERMVMNLPGEYTYYNTNHSSYFYPETEESLKNYSGSPGLIIPQTGDVMNLAGVRLEFLYTHVDYYPRSLDVFNDSSLVFRVTAAGQTILFLGDVQTEAAAVIAEMYGKELKSDMVQMAHHGYSNGGSKTLYAFIDPTVIFWPSSPALYESRSGTGTGGYVIGSLNVREVVKATEQTRTLTLPYSPENK